MIIHDVEHNTEEWLALRAGMPTASAASQLVTSLGKPSKSMELYAWQLAGEVYRESPDSFFDGNEHTRYGHETEEEAAFAYAMGGTDVRKAGFCTDDLLRYGCSPDRFVDDEGLLEIKCLPKLHIKAIRYIYYNDAPPPEYIMQPQMQMLVTGRKWCDLYFYSPHYPCKILRQYPDAVLQQALKSQLAACIIERNKAFKILESM